MAQSLHRFADRLLFVGCGTMAGAMLQRWLDSGLSPARVEIIDPALPKFHCDIAAYADIAAWEAASAVAPDWLILGVKPQTYSEVAAPLQAHVGDKTVLVSILAGVPLVDLQESFPDCAGYARVLPNMAARIGKSVSAVTTQGLQAPTRKHLDQLLGCLGAVVAMEDDSRMDLVTAYTGSGPAFVAWLIKAYAAAGERLGLSAEESMTLALATFAGTVDVLRADDISPDVLIAKVASQGGVTQAGLDVLDSDDRWIALLTDVLRTARARGRELAEEARQIDML